MHLSLRVAPPNANDAIQTLLHTMSANIPGDGWAGFGRLQPGAAGGLYERVQKVLSTANFQELEKEAIRTRRLRDKTADPELSCTIDTSSFTNGSNNLVLKVCFSDHVYWIARIQHQSVDEHQAIENADDMLSEIATMKTVGHRTTIPVPEVFAFDTSSSNPVGYPYILMEFLGGRVLKRPIAEAVPSEHLPKVAKQLAVVLVQLQAITSENFGRLWCGEHCDKPVEVVQEDLSKTSLAWFYTHRQIYNQQAMENHQDDPEWKTACWILKIAVPHIIIQDRVNGPFPLCHLDLHYGNLLFDDDYNLKGVIDWSHAHMVPIERLAVSPEFVTAPAASEERNKKILTLKGLVREHLQHLEEEVIADDDYIDGSRKTRLSEFFGTKRAEIAHRCTYSFAHRALYDGKMVAGLIYGDEVTWEQLVRVYGGLELV